MKIVACFIITIILFASCNTNTSVNVQDKNLQLVGTWKLISGTVINKGETTVTDYTKDKSFIKIINETNFAFLLHDLNKGKDSATAAFVAGGGKYDLKDSLYTEHLEYCSNRQAEGQSFTFNLTMKNDTLIQSGIEKNETTGVSVFNTEKYLRIKN
jgi:hypothetical protein